MDTSIKIQMDVKNNAQDLQNFMLDLNNWEEEMKRKESDLKKEKPSESNIPPPRNKIKKTQKENFKSEQNKPKKISAYDYSAWDKFDVEKACAEIDSEEDIEKTVQNDIDSDSSTSEEEKDESNNEKKLSLVDEAFYEKELGNQFVKKEQWNDAIKCYTNAIKLCSKNPIYYANRSLCFLKTKNLKAAEVDATVAIQLDKTYVKAYQRRAFARMALGQLKDAKSDYEKVLELEPKNTFARLEISKIEEKLQEDIKFNTAKEKITFNPKEIFKKEEKKPKIEEIKVKPSSSKPSSKELPKIKKNVEFEEVVLNESEENIERGDGDKVVVQKKEKSVFKPLPEWCRIVQPIDVPPHKRSKTPLKKVNIIEVQDDDEDFPFDSELTAPPPKLPMENIEEKKMNKIEVVATEKEKISLDIPKTSIQFQNTWKVIKSSPEEALTYLKNIPGNRLPNIFENSLESPFFSELITFLSKDDVNVDPELMYDFLFNLSKVKRFSSMVLFMSGSDRACVKKCLSTIEKHKSKEEVAELFSLYEL